MKILLFSLFILLPFTFASLGFDISIYQGALTLDDFTCFSNAGFDLVILQAWTSEGFNPYFNANFRNARLSPIPNLDIYAFICNQCEDNDPEKICDSLYKNIPGTFNGTLWLNIGPCDGCWAEDFGLNLFFIQNTVNACKARGFEKVGIYSTYSAWGSVLEDASEGTPDLQKLDLWYVHYDNDAGFDDFTSVTFGGWKQPKIKQYGGVVSSCGILVNNNFAN